GDMCASMARRGQQRGNLCERQEAGLDGPSNDEPRLINGIAVPKHAPLAGWAIFPFGETLCGRRCEGFGSVREPIAEAFRHCEVVSENGRLTHRSTLPALNHRGRTRSCQAA